MYTSLKDLVRTSGIRGLFQGVTATAARDAPYAGMYLVCYEKGKEVACKSTPAQRRVPSGRYPPSRLRSAVRMKTNEIARLILPEWGVPSGLIYSGCGMSPALLHFLGSRGYQDDTDE